MNTIVLHWVDREVNASRPFCGQRGGVLMTDKVKLVTCRACSKKLLFLENIREACRKNPLIIPFQNMSVQQLKERYPDAPKSGGKAA